MFHVEQKSLFVFILLSVLAFSGCEKADPNPELKDPIYADLQDQLSSTEKALVESNKNADEQKNLLENAPAQSGQAAVYRKRYFQAQSISDRLSQQIKYWKVRIEERKLLSRKSYLLSLKDKKSWPDPKEYEIYLSEKKLRQAKVEWDAKKRIEDFKNLSASEKKGAAEKKEE